jgi:exodeoxyribonuclease VII large subunit
VLQPYYQRYDYARDSLNQAWSERMSELHRRLELCRNSLEALNPLAVLERGYAMVTDANGQSVPGVAVLEAGQTLNLRFHDGRTKVQVEEVFDEKL